MALTIFAILIFCLNFVFLVFVIRNEMVYRFRRNLINEIFDIIRPEIRDPLIQEFRSVSYNDMVLHFWKPLPTFYSKELLQACGLLKKPQ